MPSLAEILGAARPGENAMIADIPAGWMQGRTAYGGLSSALALHATLRSADDLPPLRSAQIAFVGPLAGEVGIRTQLLRRGRNAAFIQADVTGEAGLGLRATFIFMRAIESAAKHDEAPRAPRSRPNPDDKFHVGPPDFFTGNFEFLDDKSDLAPAEWLRWARLRERGGVDPLVELLAIGDALPPAAFRLLDRPAPLSSLTWTLNLTDPAPATTDGWWLLHARADHAANGYSSQRMTIWNAAGHPIADAMQGVAIFG